MKLFAPKLWHINNTHAQGERKKEKDRLNDRPTDWRVSSVENEFVGAFTDMH